MDIILSLILYIGATQVIIHVRWCEYFIRGLLPKLNVLPPSEIIKTFKPFSLLSEPVGAELNSEGLLLLIWEQFALIFITGLSAECVRLLSAPSEPLFASLDFKRASPKIQNTHKTNKPRKGQKDEEIVTKDPLSCDCPCCVRSVKSCLTCTILCQVCQYLWSTKSAK